MKYLGLPLTAKRLSYTDCSSLIGKIYNQFQTWQQNKCLTYAGRLELIKSVILGIQTYWLSNYILPIKALEKIDSLCSAFLWGHKFHLVNWGSVCQGKEYGGLGIFSAKYWNYAAATKLLWLIHLKKDLLWIKWVHGNYLQNQNVWTVQPKTNDSWMWRQLLKMRDMLVSKFGNVVTARIADCCSDGKLLLSAVYSVLLQPTNAVAWAKTVWDGFLYPKHSFVLWLACHSRLLTKDRLCRMNILSTNQLYCVLCDRHQLETRDHILFECQYSGEVWNLVMSWLGYKWRSCTWDLLLHWYSQKLKGKSPMKKLKRMCLSAAVYMIWRERNLRIFQDKKRLPAQVFRDIKLSIFCKILNDSSHVHMK
ncbi:uncharacterized protein LOC109839283 [Asparagus officinalis]|uniref:uncharacterized protein LOC109839283 n=1 Tax=Asparagus officinalis TaxID=4686 RepID=UPI00098DEDF4|nr:uncharacterized protein LOC109839283 [Asparagus officinalis]